MTSIAFIFEWNEKLTGNVEKVCENENQGLIPHDTIVL